MTTRDDVREFLTTRRAKVQPEQVSLPGGSNRRVPGLRRNEVAMLAGVSVEYYAKLERGNLAGASDTVLAAIADALLLDDAERAHLFDLARTANASPICRRRQSPKPLRETIQWTVDGFTAGPAFVRNGRMDVLVENALFRGLYWDLYQSQSRPVNLARFTFLQRDLAENFYPSWERSADVNVGILRTEAGRNPGDKALQDLIGELSTLSDEFRTRWGAHNVRHHANGVKEFHHPIVGDLDLRYEAMEPMGDPGLNVLMYAAEPGSVSEDRLQILASWVATHEHPTDSSASAEHTTDTDHHR
ncbi:helix-turn-helix domain-containing protein [Curtobacterium sp. ME26]|uniref:MmyB family transcriptional regulator n=1 Tax=Curtobacterium sp. ME26 TaxID=2744254 RepID=UPI0015F6AF22|nr:helix-turn-helix domain-containing protein [Curtobacterium sp. ME26]